jgi:hypothetical protein
MRLCCDASYERAASLVAEETDMHLDSNHGTSGGGLTASRTVESRA